MTETRSVFMPRRSLLRFIIDHNPFFLLSAVCMLGGCLALTNSLSWSPIRLQRLLMLVVTLNIYEALLIALAIFLIAKRRLARVPTLDLWSQPEARTSAAEVEDWPRHVLVAAHVEAHRIAVGEPEDPRDVMRVNEVFEGYAPGHLASLAALPDVLSTRVINSVRTSM